MPLTWPEVSQSLVSRHRQLFPSLTRPLASGFRHPSAQQQLSTQQLLHLHVRPAGVRGDASEGTAAPGQSVQVTTGQPRPPRSRESAAGGVPRRQMLFLQMGRNQIPKDKRDVTKM